MVTGAHSSSPGLRISLDQVRTFVAVASTGSFTRAAELMGLTQPALTARVRQLEDELNLRLLDRTGRSVAPSEAGRGLLPRFMQMIDDLESAVANVQAQADEADRVVRMACLASCAATLLPDVLRDFRKIRPDASFVLSDARNSEIQQQVRDQKADFGLCVHDADEPDLVFRPLFEDHMMAVLPTNHPLTARTQVTPAEVLAYPLVLSPWGGSLRGRIERGFAAHGLAPRPAHEANHPASSVALVRAGLGVTILPSTAAELQGEGVTARPILDPAFARVIALVQREGTVMNDAASQLYRCIEARFTAKVAPSTSPVRIMPRNDRMFTKDEPSMTLHL